MKEPKRLFESGNSAERAILGFGREERPTSDLEQKALSAMAQARLANAASVTSSSAWPAPRWILAGLAAIGASALFIGLSVRDTPRVPAPPPAPVETAAPAVPAPSIARAPEEKPADKAAVVTPETLPSAPAAPIATPTASARSAPVTNSTVMPAPAPVTSASIAREVELLDGVKAKLGAGQASDAARALDAYDAEFPRGTLRPEATVLRVRALLMRGDRSGAEKVGSDFLAKQPAGVHAKRIRALLGDPGEPSGPEKK